MQRVHGLQYCQHKMFFNVFSRSIVYLTKLLKTVHSTANVLRTRCSAFITLNWLPCCENTFRKYFAITAAMMRIEHVGILIASIMGLFETQMQSSWK